MKTQNDKLKFVMEAAGECVHEIGECNFCIHCDKYFPHNEQENDGNPSPDDIGKLMELAEKLGWPDIVSGQTADGDYFADLINSDAEVMLGNSRGEALLNALFVAKGGLEDEERKRSLLR